MPEAVIVSAARSPIGRAFKGSLTTIRPDELATQMVRAALDKVPALRVGDIEDLLLGCGLPGGEQGFNLGRLIAVDLGYDTLPATTVNRFCSSSLQTTRMAAHAIRAGDGEVYLSAGVETVSKLDSVVEQAPADLLKELAADELRELTRLLKKARCCGGKNSGTQASLTGKPPSLRSTPLRHPPE